MSLYRLSCNQLDHYLIKRPKTRTRDHHEALPYTDQEVDQLPIPHDLCLGLLQLDWSKGVISVGPGNHQWSLAVSILLEDLGSIFFQWFPPHNFGTVLVVSVIFRALTSKVFRLMTEKADRSLSSPFGSPRGCPGQLQSNCDVSCLYCYPFPGLGYNILQWPLKPDHPGVWQMSGRLIQELILEEYLPLLQL